ncbi:hypothetical protein P8605_02055 [Streptomyces sp. T-3]|nr:hypothetical protein [Streptomyces sp. T-3]
MAADVIWVQAECASQDPLVLKEQYSSGVQTERRVGLITSRSW